MRIRPVVLASLSALALTATAAGSAVASLAPDQPAAVPAVAVAAAAAATDTDGDSLPDAWEINGYDANGDGVVDVNLPGMGASPNKKDLFVEMDYMSGRLATTAAFDRIVQTFANAPVSNPDGTTGIKIHLDGGAAAGAAYNLGGGNQVPYDSNLQPAESQTDAIKNANFASARKAVFHYMLWADDYDNSCSSGNAFAIPNDTFIVTMGPKCGWTTTENMNVGTFIHELGHDLGLTHGGTDSVNYKPNYLSVMNYSFQFNGVPRTSGANWFSYSNFAPPALNERSLNESVGLNTSQAATWKTSWKCPNGTTRTSGAANAGIDWNCDGDTADIANTSINGDSSRSTLTAQNNWANIRFGGGDVGGGSTAPQTKTATHELHEMTLQEYQKTR